MKGYSRFARLHVVLMTNLKLIGKSQGDTIFGDYVKDGQFQEIIVVYESDFKELIDFDSKEEPNEEPIVAQGQYKKQMTQKIRELKSEQ